MLLTSNSSSQVATIITDGINEKNKSITCRLIDGDVMKLYGNFKTHHSEHQRTQGERRVDEIDVRVREAELRRTRADEVLRPSGRIFQKH